MWTSEQGKDTKKESKDMKIRELVTQNLKFDGGLINCEEKSWRLQGQFLFAHPYRLAPLDDELIGSLTRDLKEWTLKAFLGQTGPGSFIQKILNSPFPRDMSIFTYSCFRDVDLSIHTESHQNFEINGILGLERRLRMFNHDAFLGWILDDIVDDPLVQSHPQYSDFVEFMGQTTFDMATTKSTAKCDTEVELERRWVSAGLEGKVETIENVYPWLRLYLQNMDEMKQEFPWLSPKTMEYFGASRKRVYTYLTWLDCLDHSQALSERVHIYLKRQTCGYSPPLTLMAALMGVELDMEILENRYVRRLENLTADLSYLLNDVYSLQKDIRNGDIENEIVLGVKRGMDPETAVSTVCQEHDSCLQEFGEILKFLGRREDDPKSMMMRYINMMSSFVAMLPQIHVSMDRYKGIKSGLV